MTQQPDNVLALCDEVEARLNGKGAQKRHIFALIEATRAALRSAEERAREAEGRCCLNNTHTHHYSDGYTQTCKTHNESHTTDTGWNR